MHKLILLAACTVGAATQLAACAVDPNAPAREVYRAASTTGTRLPPRDGQQAPNTMSEQELKDMRRGAGGGAAGT